MTTYGKVTRPISSNYNIPFRYSQRIFEPEVSETCIQIDSNGKIYQFKCPSEWLSHKNYCCGSIITGKYCCTFLEKYLKYRDVAMPTTRTPSTSTSTRDYSYWLRSISTVSTTRDYSLNQSSTLYKKSSDKKIIFFIVSIIMVVVYVIKYIYSKVSRRSRAQQTTQQRILLYRLLIFSHLSKKITF